MSHLATVTLLAAAPPIALIAIAAENQSDWTQITIAVVGLAAVVAPLWVTLRTQRMAAAAAASASEAVRVSALTDLKADKIINKADQIHTLTNSSLKGVRSELAVANKKIAGMSKIIGLMATAKAVASTRATKATGGRK